MFLLTVCASEILIFRCQSICWTNDQLLYASTSLMFLKAISRFDCFISNQEQGRYMLWLRLVALLCKKIFQLKDCKCRFSNEILVVHRKHFKNFEHINIQQQLLSCFYKNKTKLKNSSPQRCIFLFSLIFLLFSMHSYIQASPVTYLCFFVKCETIDLRKAMV